LIGSRLADRYEIIAELGRGGRGVVYRARDPVLKRAVAVKVVPPALSSSDTEERFQREATLVAQMDHPSIVPIFDFGRDGATLFFVMPVLEGDTLRELFRRGGLSLGEILEILAQVAEALDYSHAREVVHRDIKPENVMVTREREGRFRVRVMDFGLAQESTDNKLTRSGQLPGTLAYLSPEQVLGGPLDGRCDIYALGAILYEALRGEPPFSGTLYNVLYRVVHEAPAPLADLERVPAPLAELVLSCLSKDRGERPQRALDLANQLRHLAAGLGEQESARQLAGASRPSASRSGHPLFGRAGELAEVERRLALAAAGECQLILIGGEAGVGKSRLLAEIEELAQERRFRALRGRFAADEQGLPFHGLYEPIQDFFRFRRGSSSALLGGGSATSGVSGPSGVATPSNANLAEAGGLFGDLAARLVTVFPPLGEVPELRAVAAGAAAGEAELGPQKALDLFELLARTYSRLAGEEPLLISLENLHHDGAAAEALQYIVRRLGPSRILIAATWRSDQVDKRHPLAQLLRDFGGDPRCVQLQLQPLAGDDYRALLSSWLGGAPLRGELVDKLQAITEGNPLFTREIVASWRSSGELRQDENGRLSLRDSSGELPALPATVQQAVAQRLSHLPPALRGVLEVAAVLGRSFSEKALANLLEESGFAGELGEAVDALLQQGLLQEERSGRQELLRFAHGVVRDVLYLELPRRRRRRLHRRHAEWLEERHRDRPAMVQPQLLAHWSAAEVADKTVEYALLVAGRALASFSPQEAIAAGRRGLELAEEGSIDDALPKRAELLAVLARAHRAAGEAAAALLRAEQAADLFAQLGEIGEATQAAALAADVAWQARRAETAERWLSRGLEWARSQPKETAAAGSRPPKGTAFACAFEDLLRLAATTAGLRGERERSLTLLAELDALQKAAADREWPLGGEITAAIASEVAGLDPGNLETDEASEIGALVYETLAFFDAEGHLLPWLAAGWQEMGDGRIYVVDLRPEATFSDGSPVLASDVRASLLRAARLSARGSLAPGFYRVLQGIDSWLEGDPAADADGGLAERLVPGIEVAGPHRLIFRLTEPLPLFPVLLADMRTSVAAIRPAPDGGERLLGSGPFRIEHFGEGRVRLERVPAYWRGTPARLDAIEFETGVAPEEIAAGLRRGRIDLGRDLLPADLEALLLEPRFRSGLVERTRKNVYFLLFNSYGPETRHPEVRRLLAAAFNTYDLVWRTLGRFAQPATSLIPPGLLGHDAGRRPRRLELEAAMSELAESGRSLPVELRLLVHPVMLGKYRPLLTELEVAWRRLGIRCTIVNEDRAGFHARYRDSAGIDVMLARWNTDYDDPDNFTYNVLHSKAGIYRAYFKAEGADELLERARRLRRPSARAELYREFEDLLADEAMVLPLFYDVDYRLAGARLRGLELRSTYPYVSYAELALDREPASGPAPQVLSGGCELVVPSPLALRELDPLGQNIAGRLDLVSTVFETLLRLDDSGRLMPHLAAAVDLSADGTRLRLRLRPGVVFQDGRPITPRDVKASFERLIRRDDPTLASLLLPIRGAEAVRSDPRATLEGCHLAGRDEILIELERPYFSFPVVLTHPATSIVPAGLVNFDGRWRDGVVGSGPFRIADWVPGERLELERNPHYWREGLPRCDRLTFLLGLEPAETYRLFTAGRLALAGDLSPQHVETLLVEPPISCRLFQAPRLSTHFLVFKSRRGFFAELANRRRAIQALDLESCRRRFASRLTTAARGLIPPALLGLEQRRLGPADKPQLWLPSAPTLKVALHGCYRREYAALWQRISEDLGGQHELIDSDAETFPDRWPDPSPDLVAFRWIADYPDAGSFLQVLHFFSGLGMVAERHAEEIAARIAQARLERELPARRAHYLEIEALLEQECLVLPLFHEQAYRFAAPDLGGLRLGLGVPEVRYEELQRG
jgi:ABC-type transport system substrate-binding protein/tRNA A-37 threonylcarbamoyl transferase component Bud32